MIQNLTADYQEVLGKNRISVVKTYATWCGPCKLFKGHFSRWSENYKVYNDTEIRYYEVNSDEVPQFIREYKAKYLPSTLFFVYGVHVFTIKGITRSKVFEEILTKALEIKYTVKGN